MLIANAVVNPSGQRVHDDLVKLDRSTMTGTCEPVEEVESTPSELLDNPNWKGNYFRLQGAITNNS